MKFRKKPVVVEANQYLRRGESPVGLFGREDGSAFTITIHGQETEVEIGDWIILEDPPGDGTRAYPCKPDIFEKTYELVEEEPKKEEEQKSVWVETLGSSNLNGFGYDPKTLVLTVEFKGGGRYRYFSVPKKVFEEMKEAESKGSFFQKSVKGNFHFEKEE